MKTLKTYYPYDLNIEETLVFASRAFARFCTFFRGIRVYYVKCTNACNWFWMNRFRTRLVGYGFRVFSFIISFIIILVLLLFHYLLYYFSFYSLDAPSKLGLQKNFLWGSWRYTGFMWVFNLHRVSIGYIIIISIVI